ncbi:hypothetical protein EVAR_98071_1 [Eumeta japonica]|uniref:Uncharacterized protein n=1 Tax=Eumeta variegata TaxID=151549 RepID=A0A4C1WFH7_EUMVA|nr:hypothetical protein EVAR_98071_1 [Eumeta japonica]
MHWRGGVVIEREGMRERKERGGKRKVLFYSMSRGKGVDQPPDYEWSTPSMDTHNPKTVASALPVSWVRKGYAMEGE